MFNGEFNNEQHEHAYGGILQMDIMTNPSRIEVPEVFLKSQELVPSAKLVFIALLLDMKQAPRIRHSKTYLAMRTGLSRPTIYKAMAALKAGGWYSEDKPFDKSKFPGWTVTVYVDLLFNTALSIQSRLIHGLLQLTSGFKGKNSQFSYSSLSKEVNVGVKTVRKSVGQLARHGWLAMKQTNQLAPIIFNLRHPIKEQFDIMKAKAEKNLFTANFKGEALMKEFLSLLVPTDDYIDNAKPEFLRNTKTDCLMELDRYYPNVAAFEFNGTQHYAPTEFYDKSTVEKQQDRDLLKAQLCTDRNIGLVIIHPQDLTLIGMQNKIGGLLPLRNLRGGERLIGFLERLSNNYRKKVPQLKQQA